MNGDSLACVRFESSERQILQGTVQLEATDNVATALRPLKADEKDVAEQIPRGHKIALSDIHKGDEIIKYGQLIGYASQDIQRGQHVHVHNLEYRNVQRDYVFGGDGPGSTGGDCTDQFMGYVRENGTVGVRNTIAVLSSVNCSATAARRVAGHFDESRLRDFPNIDGVTAFVHGTGCGMADSGEGFESLQRVMWGYARNPNIAAVLMIGLGCEINQIDWLLEAYGLQSGPLFQILNIQDRCGLARTVTAGIEKIEAMLPIVNRNSRQSCPASELKVALQCGGSDAWSGITANPALGHAVDKLVAIGGSGVLAETPEIYGAEHLLTARATSPEIASRLIERIDWWHDYTARNGASLNNNPSPGNKAGGLSTILEKSLGAVSKGGKTPLRGVYRYAEHVSARGFTFMDSPGYDPASVTGQIAGGCNLVAFTTGRGSAFGSKPSPCIKIASNPEMFRRMEDDMDINAGKILEGGSTIEEVGQEIYQLLLDVASGKPSKSELQGLGEFEFVPWQIGAVV